MPSLYKIIEHCFECPINKCDFYIVINVIAILLYLINLVDFNHWEVSLGEVMLIEAASMQGCQKSSPQGPQSSHFPSYQAGKKSCILQRMWVSG